MFLTKTKSRIASVHFDSFFGPLCLAGLVDDKSPSSVQDKGIRGGVEENNVSRLSVIDRQINVFSYLSPLILDCFHPS